MSRREAFKLFAAGAVSLLGLKGLAETLRGPRSGYVMGTLVTSNPVALNGFVMGEQAHYPDFADTDAWARQCLFGDRAAAAKVVAAEIDGKWVDTSDWTPEKVRAICQPRPLKRRHV